MVGGVKFASFRRQLLSKDITDTENASNIRPIDWNILKVSKKGHCKKLGFIASISVTPEVLWFTFSFKTRKLAPFCHPSELLGQYEKYLLHKKYLE